MAGIDLLLNDKGVFIFEAPYFRNLIQHLEYDTIYHEHLSYFSLSPLASFFRRLKMEVFDVEQRDIHGGSFRVYVARQGKMPISPVIEELVQSERAQRLHDLQTLRTFSESVERNRQDLLWMLRSLKHGGARIAAVSAPAKGMTLLNYCRIGTETLDFVTEKAELKIGRFTPGTHIPVLPDSELTKRMPQYALLLAWNFAAEIMGNLHEYSERGGKFIIPIPHPRVV
jgi:C-methyltransferase C-terminal domain